MRGAQGGPGEGVNRHCAIEMKSVLREGAARGQGPGAEGRMPLRVHTEEAGAGEGGGGG